MSCFNERFQAAAGIDCGEHPYGNILSWIRRLPRCKLPNSWVGVKQLYQHTGRAMIKKGKDHQRPGESSRWNMLEWHTSKKTSTKTSTKMGKPWKANHNRWNTRNTRGQKKARPWPWTSKTWISWAGNGRVQLVQLRHEITKCSKRQALISFKTRNPNLQRLDSLPVLRKRMPYIRSW